MSAQFATAFTKRMLPYLIAAIAVSGMIAGSSRLALTQPRQERVIATWTTKHPDLWDDDNRLSVRDGQLLFSQETFDCPSGTACPGKATNSYDTQSVPLNKIRGVHVWYGGMAVEVENGVKHIGLDFVSAKNAVAHHSWGNGHTFSGHRSSLTLYFNLTDETLIKRVIATVAQLIGRHLPCMDCKVKL